MLYTQHLIYNYKHMYAQSTRLYRLFAYHTVWEPQTADPKYSSTNVKKALGVKFDLYVEAMAILFGVIVPSMCISRYIVIVMKTRRQPLSHHQAHQLKKLKRSGD